MPEKSVELVEGLILKPALNGRRTYSRQAKRALVQMCKSPGVSVAGLALAHGINANLLRRWISQYEGEKAMAAKEPRAALLPVTTTPAEPPSVPVPDCPGSIEISLKLATVRVRGTVDRQTLVAVLDCLAPRA
jgi:transposase